jgi:hypothetical protein
MYFSLSLVALIGSASSTVLWDGRFAGFKSSADLNNWSWSNQVGPYQYYIVSLSSWCCCRLLIREAWTQWCKFLHQSRQILQEPCRYEQSRRRQVHLGLYFILEWPEHAPNRIDPPNDCSNQQGNSLVSFQHHA